MSERGRKDNHYSVGWVSSRVSCFLQCVWACVHRGTAGAFPSLCVSDAPIQIFEASSLVGIFFKSTLKLRGSGNVFGLCYCATLLFMAPCEIKCLIKFYKGSKVPEMLAKKKSFMRFYPKSIGVGSCIVTMRSCSVFWLCPRKTPGWRSDSETFHGLLVWWKYVFKCKSDIRALKTYTAENKILLSLNSSHHELLTMVCSLLDNRCENIDLVDKFWHPKWY